MEFDKVYLKIINKHKSILLFCFLMYKHQSFPAIQSARKGVILVTPHCKSPFKIRKIFEITLLKVWQ